MTSTRFRLVLLSASVLGACTVGDPEGICDTNPGMCMSAREAHAASNGIGSSGGAGPIPLGPIAGQPGMLPPDTDAAALERGKAMRIWTAPYQDDRGALHVSGYTFVQMHEPGWDVSQTSYYWTAR